MSKTELTRLREWIGRGRTREDTPHAGALRAMAATLSLPAQAVPTGQLPPLWQVMLFADGTPTTGLNEDGTPRDQGLMPPVQAEQIMWAGAEYEFFAPLRVGTVTTRESRVADIESRQGSRGPMTFVSIEHRYLQDGQACIAEVNRAVFLGPARPGGAPAASPPPDASRERQWPVDEALLFRFSALTFNSHRIHYDHRYAASAGYPGLVVHGPLQALLLAETWRGWHPQQPLRRAAFRARAPLFLDGQPVTVREAAARDGASATMWTCDARGTVAMSARFEA